MKSFTSSTKATLAFSPRNCVEPITRPASASSSWMSSASASLTMAWKVWKRCCLIWTPCHPGWPFGTVCECLLSSFSFKCPVTQAGPVIQVMTPSVEIKRKKELRLESDGSTAWAYFWSKSIVKHHCFPCEGWTSGTCPFSHTGPACPTILLPLLCMCMICAVIFFQLLFLDTCWIWRLFLHLKSIITSYQVVLNKKNTHTRTHIHTRATRWYPAQVS